MDWKLKQLFMPNRNENGDYPNFENKLQPRMQFSTREIESLYHEHEDCNP